MDEHVYIVFGECEFSKFEILNFMPMNQASIYHRIGIYLNFYEFLRKPFGDIYHFTK